MPDKSNNQEELPQVSWVIDESKRYRRGGGWYIVMTLIAVSLLIYAVISANFLFALLVLMFALVIYLTSVRGAENINVDITQDGIKVDSEFFPFRDIKRYWFIYDPPEVKSLYLDFKGVTRPVLALSLMDQNPNQIREILGQYLPEDFSEDEEPFMDFLGRIMKL